MYDAGSSLNSKGITIGKEERPGINSISPGPGAYNAKEEVIKSSSKTVTIGTSGRADNFGS